MVSKNIKTFIDKSVSYNSSSKSNSNSNSKPSSKPNKGSVNVTKILETLQPNEASKLQDYLDTELLFYGSIKRLDYFKNNSDIDIAIITEGGITFPVFAEAC